MQIVHFFLSLCVKFSNTEPSRNLDTVEILIVKYKLLNELEKRRGYIKMFWNFLIHAGCLHPANFIGRTSQNSKRLSRSKQPDDVVEFQWDFELDPILSAKCDRTQLWNQVTLNSNSFCVTADLYYRLKMCQYTMFWWNNYCRPCGNQ